MAQLGLAPNAIVLLHNLCYASGNSEPGGAAPTVSRSPASGSTTTPPGFLKAGAAAVIADGHMGPAAYLAALFTTGQSIVDLWRPSRTSNGHDRVVRLDPDARRHRLLRPETPTSGFYRSLVARPAP